LAVGNFEGKCEGEVLGKLLELAVGNFEGKCEGEVEGKSDGSFDGSNEGKSEGRDDGVCVVEGFKLGDIDGKLVDGKKDLEGLALGNMELVGALDASIVGSTVGNTDGLRVVGLSVVGRGDRDGTMDGFSVGFSVVGRGDRDGSIDGCLLWVSCIGLCDNVDGS